MDFLNVIMLAGFGCIIKTDGGIMKITKNLTFSHAIQNIKDNLKAVIGTIALGIAAFFILVYLGEHRHISQSGAVVMGQGLFLGVVIALGKIVLGKRKLK